MAYRTHNSIKDRPGAVIAVIGIHALIGYGLVIGLAPGIFEPEQKDGPIIGFPVPPVAPPPPPEPTAEPQPKTSPPIPAPRPPIDFTRDRTLEVEDIIIPGPGQIDPFIGDTGPITPPLPPADPPPAFTPEAASPKNGGWIRDSDYRTRWVREELAGLASFKVGVGTNGRVTDCAITKSTGHSALDQATCTLIKKRARFDAAKDNQGSKVAGTYRGSVQWTLPD